MNVEQFFVCPQCEVTCKGGDALRAQVKPRL